MIRWPLQIVIPGRVVAKKNAKKCVKRGSSCRLVAKKEWDDYLDHAMDYFTLFHAEMKRKGISLELPLTIEQPLHVWFHYHPTSHVRPDLSAVAETVGDLLEPPKYGTDKKTGLPKLTRKGGNIITDDKNIMSWDGSRLMEIRKTDPKLIIWVSPYQPIEGEYVPKHARRV